MSPHSDPARTLISPCSAGFLQFDVRSGDIDANLARVEEGLARLAPQSPGLVVLPELWATGFAYDRLEELSQRTPDILAALTRLAGRHNILLAGSLPEAVDGGDGPLYHHNTLYLTGPEGVMGHYRKQHLFAPMAEDRHFSPGTSPHPLATPFGRVAPLICYDLRFPELAKGMAGQGASILVVSAQWPALRSEHWQTLVRARAMENQMFAIACNRCGTTGDTTFAGQSLIVAPDGTILAKGGTGEEARGVALDPSMLAEVRGRFNTVAPRPYPFPDTEKVVELPRLREIVRTHKAVGRRVVFTNGCFDILHPGHVTYLEAARRLGDCLIVGLNSDASIRAIKGPERPVNAEQNRARLLAALGCVDHVVLFGEETPLNLITTLLPDVLIKGGDWAVDQIVGGREVVAAGGVVANLPLVENFSTTALIDRIRNKPDRQ
ncbi:MAG: D-glycero-beta-D-manno-heptose 1-phosphate adenylyltransferase [Desulfobulbaceae bacterium]|nr:D-glycero-beta-D-manno-heptose 1-phosphate adenylyltransferase [Desulfobulbaceae bacterium]